MCTNVNAKNVNGHNVCCYPPNAFSSWVSICLSLKEGQHGKLTQQLQASTLLTWALRHPFHSSAIWRVMCVWRKWSESPALDQSFCVQSTLCRFYSHSRIYYFRWWTTAIKSNWWWRLIELGREANTRLVVHVDWAVLLKKCMRIVMASNDTGTTVSSPWATFLRDGAAVWHK